MKIKWYLFLLPAFLVITGCSKEETETEPQPKPEPEKQVNSAPAVPEPFYPADNADCTPANLNLQWKPAIDPDGDEVTYRVELSTDRNFEKINHFKSTLSLKESVSLEKGVVYYWRVRATDLHSNKSDFSPVLTFSTEPDPGYNNIPFMPVQIQPGNNSLVEKGQVVLKWNAEDPDGDELTYELYFGSENPPQLFKTELKETSLEINVEPATTYFWKIAVIDESEAKAVGEVWTFKAQ